MTPVTDTPDGRFALVNGSIALPDELLQGQALLIEGSRIVAVTPPRELGEDLPRCDIEGRLVAPGLVDIHTHGALGYSFLDNNDDAFSTITREQARRGVTSILVTTSTAPIAVLARCLEVTREWMGKSHEGSQVLGAHAEGPYFNREQAGAQDPKNVRNPDDGTVDELLEHADALRLMSLAPELPGALELTKRLTSLGIVAAAGHSSAVDTELQAAVDAGVTHVIHLWSGQSTTVRNGPWRRPGMIEASLASDSLTAEMIADGKHLPATLMKLAYRCLGPDRICLVSDATNGAGLEDGTRFRMGEMEYEVDDGVGMMLDRSGFAGSTTFLSQMLPRVVDLVGVPLAEVIRMASLTPARVIGVDDRKGSIAAGKDADLAIFERDLNPWRTMIAGKWN